MGQAGGGRGVPCRLHITDQLYMIRLRQNVLGSVAPLTTPLSVWCRVDAAGPWPAGKRRRMAKRGNNGTMHDDLRCAFAYKSGGGTSTYERRTRRMCERAAATKRRPSSRFPATMLDAMPMPGGPTPDPAAMAKPRPRSSASRAKSALDKRIIAQSRALNAEIRPNVRLIQLWASHEGSA